MSKIAVAAVIFGLILFLYLQKIESYFNEIHKAIEANSLVLMKVADEKQNTNEHKLAKINLNIQAFQGLDCARCHITDERLLLPFKKLSMEEYISIVRNGVKSDSKTIMPSYDETQMTDNALRIQYRILSKYFENQGNGK